MSVVLNICHFCYSTWYLTGIQKYIYTLLYYSRDLPKRHQIHSKRYLSSEVSLPSTLSPLSELFFNLTLET